MKFANKSAMNKSLNFIDRGGSWLDSYGSWNTGKRGYRRKLTTFRFFVGFTGTRPSLALTPPERQASQDNEENASVAGSDVLLDFNPAGLAFNQIHRNPTLTRRHLLPLRSYQPPRRSKKMCNERHLRPVYTRGILGVHLDRFYTIASRVRNCILNSSLHPPGRERGQPLTNSTMCNTGFNLNWSLDLGSRPGLHLRSFPSLTREPEGTSASPRWAREQCCRQRCVRVHV